MDRSTTDVYTGLRTGRNLDAEAMTGDMKGISSDIDCVRNIEEEYGAINPFLIAVQGSM